MFPLAKPAHSAIPDNEAIASPTITEAFITDHRHTEVCLQVGKSGCLPFRRHDPETVIRAIFVASQLQTFIHVLSGSRAASISASWPS